MPKHNSITLEPGIVYKCRDYIKKRIMQPEGMSDGCDKQLGNLLTMMKRTVDLGESNSALLLGPRGCGKSMLVNTALENLKSLDSFQEKAVVVELNGLIHTDDRLALKDMTRQMGLENVANGRVFATFSENLGFLLDCLKSGNCNTSKSTLIVLDEFDLFCSHNKQTLLYNLFDVAQSAQAPLCVIGVTCRLDVIELLEKRVKSRFSHRQLFLFTKSQGKKAFADRSKLHHSLLTLPLEDKELDIEPMYSALWNKNTKAVLESPEVQDVCRSLFQFDASQCTFRSFLTVVVSRITASHPFLHTSDFIQVHSEFMEDPKVNLLKGLSVLEMCLIIAMKHYTEIFDGNPLNFEIIFRSYQKFVSKNSSVHVTERSVILKAFEHIKNLELIMPVARSSKHVQAEHQMHHFHLTSEQVNTAVKTYQNLPTEVSQWAFSSFQ